MIPLSRALARLLPRRFRERFGDDLVELMAKNRDRAGARGGRIARWRQSVLELASLLRLSIDLRRDGTQEAPVSGSPVSTWAQDLRAAIRYARRRPAAALAIVITLASVMTAVVLTVVIARSILWRPLPFESPDRLYFVWESVTRDGVPAAGRVTRGRFLSWRAEGRAFESLASFAAWGLRLDDADGGRTMRGLRVSPNYFDVLGVKPLHGRGFAESEASPGAPPVIVLSSALWREIGGSPDIVGTELRLSGDLYRVIGVMPPVVSPGFPVNPANVSVDPGQREFWVPIIATPDLDANTRSHVFGVIGRIAAGRDPRAAEAALAATAAPDGPEPHGARVVPFRSQLVGDARSQIVVLLAAALAVFLIAGANLAALLASAFELRRDEFSVRMALGAGVWRLARQLILEAFVTAGLAGALALGALEGLIWWMQTAAPENMPWLTPPQLDATSLAVTVVLVIGAALLVNLWPIVKLTRATDGARSRTVRSRLSAYRGFVVVQVAVTLALVTVAAMLGRSLQHVYGRDPGFALDHTMVASLGLVSGTGASPESINATTQDVLTAARAVPGVRAVAAAYDHPLAANWIEAYRITGESSGTSAPARQAELRVVTPSYFEAVRTTLTDGRVFSDGDSWRSAGVAVVNESFARELGGRAIGRRIETGTPSRNWPGAPMTFEIVGVVEDERFHGLEEASRPAMYLSTWQFPQAYVMLLVRTEADPLAVSPAVREAVRRVRGSITFDRVTSLERILANQLLTRRVTTGVVTTFGLLALVLAAIGLYGLVAVSTADRRREIAIRAALGASRSSIVGAVMWDGVRSTVIGSVAGIGLAVAAGPLVASQLVDIPSGDPVTLLVATSVLLGVTGLATAVPAVRASGTNPAQALRADG